MGAAQHLAQFGVSVGQAKQFVDNCLNNSDFGLIYRTCKDFGVTNDMLAEIYGGVTADQVRGFFTSLGYDGRALDAGLSVSNTKLLSDDAANQLGSKAAALTSSDFLARIIASVEVGGADLDLDGVQEFTAESSLYTGGGADVPTFLNYMVQLSAHLTTGNMEILSRAVEAVLDLGDQLVTSGGPSALASIYGTPQMQAYYNTVNAIVQGGEPNSAYSGAALDQVGNAILTGIQSAYSMYSEYDQVFFL